MTEPEQRHFSVRAFLAELGPEGRKNLTVVLLWFTAMLAAAVGCGVVIGLLL